MTTTTYRDATHHLRSLTRTISSVPDADRSTDHPVVLASALGICSVLGYIHQLNGDELRTGAQLARTLAGLGVTHRNGCKRQFKLAYSAGRFSAECASADFVEVQS